MSKDITKAAEANSAIVSAADAKAAQIQTQLDEQKAIVLEQHQICVAAKDEAVIAAITAGIALNKIKKNVPHGEWAKWMGKNMPKISDRSIQVYMRAAKFQAKLMKKQSEMKSQNASVLSLNAAMKELAGPSRKNNSSTTAKKKPTAKTTEAATGETVGTVQWFVELSAQLRQIATNPEPVAKLINASNREAMNVALRELKKAAITLADAFGPSLEQADMPTVDIQQATVISTKPLEEGGAAQTAHA